jgi:hypothetical protein
VKLVDVYPPDTPDSPYQANKSVHLDGYSWFAAFDRDPQTYVPNIHAADAHDIVRATHRVWVDRTAPSGIEVQVLP